MASRCANVNEILLGRDIGEGHPVRELGGDHAGGDFGTAGDVADYSGRP
jgi:hypothetical protein